MTNAEYLIDTALTQATAQGDKGTPRRELDDNRFMQDWPEEVLNPPGLVGEVVRWIKDSSGVEQPKFALAAGLTVCGALVGRKVRDFTGQRTNLNTLVMGGTSSGKNAPIQSIGKLTVSMGAEHLIIGELTSDSALEAHLVDNPTRLILLDEVGKFLTNIKAAGQSNGHLRTVIPALTKCWSAAGGIYLGKARAKDGNGNFNPSKQIHEPCVCIYGTSAPEPLFDAMTESDFTDGSVPRFIPFISETRPKFEAKREIAVPDVLVTRLGDALSSLGISTRQDGKAAGVPSAMLVKETEEATSVFAELEDIKCQSLRMADIGQPELNLYGKIGENARRIALTVAVFRSPMAPLIEKQDATYGCELMLHATRDMVATVRDRVASNKTERNKRQLRLIIRKAGECGISQSDLTRATPRLKTWERDEAIQDLIEAEVIVGREEPGSGRKKIHRFFFIG